MDIIDLNGCFPTSALAVSVCAGDVRDANQRHLVQTGHVHCAGPNPPPALFGYF